MPYGLRPPLSVGRQGLVWQETGLALEQRARALRCVGAHLDFSCEHLVGDRPAFWFVSGLRLKLGGCAAGPVRAEERMLTCKGPAKDMARLSDG